MPAATATRPRLSDDHVSDQAAAFVAARGGDALGRIATALREHDVVVVGMAQNPHVGRARRALTEGGISHEYLEFGSYFSEWRTRLAIKLWSGWPTFPQVFVKGTLIGGEDLTKAALADGSLQARLEG